MSLFSLASRVPNSPAVRPSVASQAERAAATASFSEYFRPSRVSYSLVVVCRCSSRATKHPPIPASLTHQQAGVRCTEHRSKRRRLNEMNETATCWARWSAALLMLTDASKWEDTDAPYDERGDAVRAISYYSHVASPAVATSWHFCSDVLLYSSLISSHPLYLCCRWTFRWDIHW